MPKRMAAVEPPIAAVADQLAKTAYEQLSEEADARGLRQGRMIPVEWTQTNRPITDPPARIRRPGGRPTRIVQMSLEGRLDADAGADKAAEALAADFRALPNGRVVLLGEPGAGKSVLAFLLTLGLLAGRPDGSAVALLLSASSWDPPREDLDSWIIRILAETYYNGRTETATRLFQRGLILPVIDGIDEIYELGRNKALGSLNDAIMADRAIVVTCRSVEYQDLVTGGSDGVSEAPVIEIKPVPAATLTAFLRDATRQRAETWERVFDHLEAHPQGVLARALSTPLMAALARTAYERLARDPSELVHPDRFATRSAIEDHIVDLMVDAAYAPAGSPVGRWSTTAEHARKWLGVLAREMLARHERDLHWWSLVPRLAGAWVGPALGVTAGLVFMAATTTWVVVFAGGSADPGRTLTYSAWVGGVLAILSTVVWYAAGDRPPRRTSLRAHRSARHFRTGFAHGTAVGAFPAVPTALSAALIVTLSNGWSLWNLHTYVRALGGAAGLVLALGLAIGLQRWLDTPPDSAVHATPGKSMIEDRRSALLGALVTGCVLSGLALVATLLGTVAADMATNLVSRWSGWPGHPAFAPVVDAAITDILPGPVGSLPVAVGAFFILPGVSLGWLVLLTRAWPRFVIVRCNLAWRRRLPWQLPAFLADARDRGVLRQSGTAYQFRHIRLQDRLADERHRRAAVYRHAQLVAPSRGGRRGLAATAAVIVLMAGSVALTRVPRDLALFAMPGAHGRGPYEASVSADQTLIATSSERDTTVRLWDAASGRKISELTGNVGGAGSVSFTANDRLVVVEGGVGTHDLAIDSPRDNTDRVFDLTSGRLLTSASSAYIVARGNAVVTQNYNQTAQQWTIQVWNAATGERKQLTGEHISFDAHSLYRTTPHHDFLVTETDDRIRIRDGRTGSLILELPPDEPPGIFKTEISADGQHVNVARPGRLSSYNAASGSRLGLITGFDSDPSENESVDEGAGRVIVTSGRQAGVKEDDDTVSLVDLRNGRSQRLVSGLTAIKRIAFTGGGRYVAVYSGKDPREYDGDTLSVFDAASGKPVVANRAVTSYRIDPTGRLLASVAPGADRVELFNLQTRTIRAELEGTASDISYRDDIDLRFAPDGNTLYSTYTGSFRMWSATTGALLAQGPSDYRADRHDRISADGETLAVQEDGGVRLWEIRTGRNVGLLSGVRIGDDPLDNLYISDRAETTIFRSDGDQLVFSRDGRHVITLVEGDERVRVYDARTARLLTTLTGHRGAIRSMALAADGTTLMTAGARDDTIRMWRPEDAT
jgi:WD40 repeat protein